MRRNRSQGALSSGDGGDCLAEEDESDIRTTSKMESRVPSLTRLLDGSGGDPESRKSLPEIRQRLIVVANRLPVSARKKPGGGWVLEVRSARNALAACRTKVVATACFLTTRLASHNSSACCVHHAAIAPILVSRADAVVGRPEPEPIDPPVLADVHRLDHGSRHRLAPGVW